MIMKMKAVMRDEIGEGGDVDSPKRNAGNNLAVPPMIPPVITVQRKGACCCGCGKDAPKSNYYCLYTKKRGIGLVLSPKPENSREPWKQSMVQGVLQPARGERGGKQANQSSTNGDS
jgi:hypothetical protein